MVYGSRLNRRHYVEVVRTENHDQRFAVVLVQNASPIPPWTETHHTAKPRNRQLSGDIEVPNPPQNKYLRVEPAPPLWRQSDHMEKFGLGSPPYGRSDNKKIEGWRFG